MNPNENNPMSPMGAGSAPDGAAPAPGAGSVDFTNSASLNGNDSANSGASNETSPNIDGTVGGVAPAMPPLTPAEPVPGSIGSVTSVPPLAPEPMDMSALGGTQPTTSNMPVMGQAAETKPAGNDNAAGGSPYYNPFMRNNVGNGSTEEKPAAPASSASVPPALQPQTNKFSERLQGTKEKKKSGNIMMLLGWLLAVLFLVTTVVFVIMWQGEANKKPEVVYYPSNDNTQEPEEDDPEPEVPEEPTEPVVAVLKCGVDMSGEEAGMENVVSARNEMAMNYTDGEMVDVSMNISNTFTDSEAATAAKPTYDSMMEMMNAMFEAAGDEAIGFSSDVAQIDNVITYDVTMPASMLTAENMTVTLPTKEDGSLDTSLDAMKAAIEADGYVCTVE